MKKSILMLAMSAFFLIGLTSMMTTDPPANTTCGEQCEFLVDAGVFSGNGACMSACNTCLNPGQGAGVIAACNCKLIDDVFGGLEANGFTNMGECIKFIKDLIS